MDAVPGVGQPFDPNFHDAVMREQNNDVPDGTVLHEFRKGFRHGDKLLRPAMVKVRVLLNKQAVELAWQPPCHARLDAQAAADHAQATGSEYGVPLTAWQGSRLHRGRHAVEPASGSVGLPDRKCGSKRSLYTAEACQRHCMGLLGGDGAAVMLSRHCMLAVLAALLPR